MIYPRSQKYLEKLSETSTLESLSITGNFTTDIEKVVPEETPKKEYLRTQTLSEDGEILCEHTQLIRKKNGSGFVISYTEKIIDLILNCSSSSTLRIFTLIAHKQTYTGGFRTSRQYFAEIFKIDRRTVYRALEWLKKNFIINEMRIDGSLEFMVNPEYVTVGSDRDARFKIWNSRWVKQNREKHPDLISCPQS